MSLLWIDGFEWLGATVGSTIDVSYLNVKYPTVYNNPYVRDGRTGGYAIGGQNGYAMYLTTPAFSAADTTYVVGCGLRTSTSTSSLINILTFYRGATVGIRLEYQPSSGEITVYNNAASLGTTTGAGIVSTGWYYVEVKVVDAETGSVTLRVDGETVLSLTGVDTRAGGTVGYDRCRFDLSTSQVPYLRLDDLYILNGAGSTCNDFLGDCQIRAIWPTSDGDLSQWSTSSGSDHYALVDDNPCNSDTDYVSAASTLSNLYGYGTASDLGRVKGIQINSCAKELAEASVPAMKNLIKYGETVYDSSVPVITTGYTVLYSIHQVNPATSGSWSVSEINTAQYGLKRE
jgi:hypothetical protein